MNKDGPHSPSRERAGRGKGGPAPPPPLPIRGTDHFPVRVGGKLLREFCWQCNHTPNSNKSGLYLPSVLQVFNLCRREQYGEAVLLKELLSTSFHFKRFTRPESQEDSLNDSSARPVRAGAGGPVAQGRAGKEGAGKQGRVYKGRHPASSLLRSAESAAGAVGEEGGSRKGERQTAVTSAVQEPGYLFIRYPFSFPFRPFSFPLLLCFVFFFPFWETKNLRKGGGERLSLLFVSPPPLPPPPSPSPACLPPRSGRSFPAAARTGSELLGGGGAGFL